MRDTLIPFVCLSLLAGCSGDDGHRIERSPIRIDDLAIPVLAGSRSYMQSDRGGAFLTGVVGGGEGGGRVDGDSWSVEGVEVLKRVQVEWAEGVLSAERLDSARILPFETTRYYRGGSSVSVSAVEAAGSGGVHAFVVRAALPHPGSVTLHASPGAGSAAPGPGHLWAWQLAGGGSVLVTAGSECSVRADGVSLDGPGKATFLVCALPPGADRGIASLLYGRADSLLAARRMRMENLLNTSYFRTSDDTLDRAVHWMMLALDALMVDGRDTFAVSGLPWDGSIDVRDNAQSIAGLGLATGDYPRTAAILRSLSRYQDTLRRSGTYGRLPDRIVNGRPSYGGADVTPWFVRELYEQVVNTDDTTLVRALFPLITKSIDGTLRTHADRYNLLVHGPRETWMKGVDRGNRAVEIQASWYFQQLIGRFVASYLRDTAASRRWEDLPEKTARNFTLLFTDSAAHTLADHIEADGTRSTEIRPNGVMCLEMLDEETLRHGVTRTAVAGLLSPEGVRTLAPSDPRFSRSPGAPGWAYDGPVWTWLAGPVSYALTRYDRQDVSYPLIRRMATLALSGGMAGTLPALLDPSLGGQKASLTGMSEFMRSVYQDYFGVRVDMAAGTFVLQPKLPASLSVVQFTVFAGSSPIEVEYRRTRENTRLHLDAPALPKEMKVNLLWIMENGDAWRGSFRLRGGVPVAIVLGDDDAVLFQGDSRGDLDGKRKLKGFSQRKDALDLSPAP
jgi:hypothetical protein